MNQIETTADSASIQATSGLCLPAMSDQALEKTRALQDVLAECAQVQTPTEHLIHAGMYARTVRLPAGVVMVGTLVKVATTVIVSGDCTVYTGEQTIELRGYNVLAGSVGRKQSFVTHSEVCITAIFPTDANTVAQAEAQATDEHNTLLSRRQEQSLQTQCGSLHGSGICHSSQ